MICPDCNTPRSQHVETWIDGLFSSLPQIRFSAVDRFTDWFFLVVERLVIAVGIARWDENFSLHDIQLRSACFVEEARKRNIPVAVLKSRFGVTGHFRITVNGKTFRFDGLPLGKQSGTKNEDINDKEKAKKILRHGNFPIAEGKTFWWWQKNSAKRYVEQTLHFPVVVKPRNGYLCRHITTHIANEEQLRAAIHHALEYSPSFCVERFVEGTVYRITVIDKKTIAAVAYVPANIIGNGKDSIRALVEQKNADRGIAPSKKYALYKITLDAETDRLLSQQHRRLDSVPANGERVWLHNAPYQRLGGDLEEVTESIHPENLELFRSVARFVETNVLGFDIIMQNIREPWKQQQCAILELSDLPCIEMHQFPSTGMPQHLGTALLAMVMKDYR